jgi:hypothetical protein
VVKRFAPKATTKPPEPERPIDRGVQAADVTPTDLIPLAEARLLMPSPRPGKRTNLATVYRMIVSGQLRAWRRGRWLFVSKAEVLEMPERVKRTPRPPPVEERADLDRWRQEGMKRFGLKM